MHPRTAPRPTSASPGAERVIAELRLSPREKRVLRALISFQAFDGISTAMSAPWVVKCLDDVHCPQSVRPWLSVVKAASVIGLLGGERLPWLGRLTSVGLTMYFLLAVGSHLRARDIGANFTAACGMLGLVIATTRPFWRPRGTHPPLS